MGIWIDTPQWHDAATLNARDVDGVLRYLCMPYNTGPGSSMPNKRLERAELDEKIAAGIDVAVNWEDAADDYLGGYSRGKDKGARAADWMRNVLAFPDGASCCSSLDADIGASWGGVAEQYQRGFADGLTSNGPYIPGVYGSAVAINGALADGTASVFWLTAASSWSHGQTPRRLHIRQNGLWRWGADADLDDIIETPFGSYLHAGGSLMPMDLSNEALDAVADRLRGVLGVKAKFTVPEGLTSNDTVLSRLIEFERGQFNSTNQVLAALRAIKSDTAAGLDDEAHVLTAIAAMGTVNFPAEQIPILATEIAHEIGTPVDEEALAKALRLDLAATLAGGTPPA